MGFTVLFPDTVEVIDAIRSGIGRDVIFYSGIITTCSACSLDPVTNTSTNPFCLPCGGEHYITVFTGITLTGHITWGSSDSVGWVTGGQMMEGDCRVQIKYTVLNEDIVNDTEYLVVDGKTMEIKKRIMRGVKQLNRILLELIER